MGALALERSVKVGDAEATRIDFPAANFEKGSSFVWECENVLHGSCLASTEATTRGGER
jgi:hypothetical protein